MSKRKVTKSRFVAFLPALLFPLFLLSAPIRSDAQEKKSIRVVFVSLSWNSEIPVRVAMAKGYFKEQGITMEPIFVRGGPTAVAALASGDVDFGSIGGAQAIIRSKSRGLDVQIIGSISNKTNYILLGNKETKRLDDLKGKLVGVTGARQDLAATLDAFLSRVRAATPVPLVVGFGISQPRHVERVADLGASGVIVASALADLIERSDDPVAAAREYLMELKSATRVPASRR